MGGQAAQLQDLMGFFTVEGASSKKVGAGGTAKAARPAPAPKPMQRSASISTSEADFERF
jgi:hypothetical protein